MSAASPSHTSLPHDYRSIELLTIQALDAARAGDWDQVDACYRERGMSLAACTSTVRSHSGFEHGRRSSHRYSGCSSRISGLLVEAAQVTRHLHRLRESNGQLASDRVTIHREA